MDYRSDTEVNLLLQRVKDELTDFVQQQTSKLPKESTTGERKTQAATTSFQKEENHQREKRSGKLTEEEQLIWDALSTDNAPVISLELLERVDEAEKDALSMYKESRGFDEQLQKMQVDLKETYDLFSSIGNKFESISFENLKDRIKNLSMGVPKNPDEAAQRAELRDIFEKNFSENRLSQASQEVGEQMRKYPTEFGGIPEVSAFFSACNQLQRGLEKLQKQRKETYEFTEKLERATEETYRKIDKFREEYEKSN